VFDAINSYIRIDHIFVNTVDTFQADTLEVRREDKLRKPPWVNVNSSLKLRLIVKMNWIKDIELARFTRRFLVGIEMTFVWNAFDTVNKGFSQNPDSSYS
jgi:hypothetical protein